MAEGIVIYKSRYGATARYAAWIAEATGFETAESSDAAIRQAADCTAVVFAGGVYASGVAGISLMKKNSAMLAGKRTALLCVGASPWDEGAIALLRARNLKGVLEGVPLFYARGAWDEDKMSFADRTLCRMLQKSVAKKDPAGYEPWEAARMCARGQSCDWTSREQLEPLLEYLK